MPKMKTHKATAKRVTVTGSGRIMRKRSGMAHLLRKKNGKLKRRGRIKLELAAVDYKRISQLISPRGEI